MGHIPKIPGGSVFHRLTVLGYERNSQGRGQYRCRCVCGKTVFAEAHQLNSGRVKSCGCLRWEGLKRGFHAGKRDSLLVASKRSWNAMFSRCYDPRIPGFANYGGRGICVCPSWFSFDVFFSDMGKPPQPKGYSIERIDVNGNYEPSNCKWIPRRDQSKNRRNTRYLEVYGIRRSISDWADATGLSLGCIYQRLMKDKTPEQCIAPLRGWRTGGKHAGAASWRK